VRDQLLFGRRIRAIRKAANLSREKLAERTDITSNYLGEIERGEKWPSLQILSALATALDVSPAKFFELDSAPNDGRALRKQLDQFLAQRDTKELQQIQRLLAALFDI
jgi:XRE family transcriptional regulator, regulator of sulfur utilization